MNIMVSEEQKKLVSEVNATGTFTASDGAGWNLESTQVLFMPTAYQEFWVLGLDQFTQKLNSVIFAIPQSVPGYTPCTVYVGDKEWEQKWEVDIEGQTFSVESGWVKVELANNKKTIKGTLEFSLKGGPNVTGDFHIFS
jgi:hypothetical protein